jgi:hypothetical protein
MASAIAIREAIGEYKIVWQVGFCGLEDVVGDWENRTSDYPPCFKMWPIEPMEAKTPRYLAAAGIAYALVRMLCFYARIGA